MTDKLNIIKQRFDEVSDLIIQPDIISDQKKYIQINKEYKDLKTIMDQGDIYISLVANINEGEKILKEETDSEMIETPLKTILANNDTIMIDPVSRSRIGEPTNNVLLAPAS